MHLSINYSILKKAKWLFITTAVVTITSNLTVYFHPANQDWIGSPEFSWLNLIKFLILDQYLMELFTVTIIFGLIWFYAHRLKLYEIALTPEAIFSYLLKFLPVLLLSFFFFNPVTQTVRFLVIEGFNAGRDIYFSEYLFNFRLYATYLIPVFLTGYGILIANLVTLYNKQLKSVTEDHEKQQKKESYISTIMAQDDWGEVPLKVVNALWFEKKDRKYFAQTLKGKLRTRETISELESSLDPDKFVRINRSVIVNVRSILNYSFWENEKYILRLNDEKKTEFIMSRDRLKKIKSQLQLVS